MANVDARAAIKAARSGNCRDAMRYLWDAMPHMQAQCESPTYQEAMPAAREAFVIVDQLCVRPGGKRRFRGQHAFQGVKRKRRR